MKCECSIENFEYTIGMREVATGQRVKRCAHCKARDVAFVSIVEAFKDWIDAPSKVSYSPEEAKKLMRLTIRMGSAIKLV